MLLAKEREACISEFKNKELPKIIEQKYRDWETVDLIQLIHTERNQYIIENILAQHRKEWERERLRQKGEFEGKMREVRQSYEDELIELRQELERLKVSPAIQVDMGEWERAKNMELESRIKEVEHYW